jgi:hypothetical protein
MTYNVGRERIKYGNLSKILQCKVNFIGIKKALWSPRHVLSIGLHLGPNDNMIDNYAALTGMERPLQLENRGKNVA